MAKSNPAMTSEVEELKESMTWLDVKAEYEFEDMWYGPNLLNVPQMIDCAQKELKLAESAASVQPISMVTELALQDSNLQIKSTEQVGIKTLQDPIIVEQNKCNAIRDQCGDRYWFVISELYLDPEEVKKLQERWMSNSIKYIDTSAEIKAFCSSKIKSPDESAADPDVDKLMNSLQEIHDDTLAISKMLDYYLNSPQYQTYQKKK